jgi:hypothetical protein
VLIGLVEGTQERYLSLGGYCRWREVGRETPEISGGAIIVSSWLCELPGGHHRVGGWLCERHERGCGAGIALLYKVRHNV